MPYFFTQVLTLQVTSPLASDNPCKAPLWLDTFLIPLSVKLLHSDARAHCPTPFGFWLCIPSHSTWVDNLLNVLGSAALIQAVCLCGHHPQSTKVLYLMWLQPHVWMQLYPCRLHYTIPGSLHGLPPPSVSHIPQVWKAALLCPKELWNELFREERKKEKRRKMNYFKSFRGE